MKEIILFLPGIFILLIIAIGGFFEYRYEKKLVKQGHCGLPWKTFDMDSSGAIGIKCRKCKTYGGWISWCKKDLLDSNITY
jgi:hypothetical protein